MIDQTLSSDYYKVLGINKSSNEKSIKRSYRKLAGKWHPDRFQNPKEKKDAEAKFKRIGEAYSILSDPKKKDIYDRFGKEALKGNMQGDFSFGNANDIFRMFFEQEGGSPFDDLLGGLSGGQRRNKIPKSFSFSFGSNMNGFSDFNNDLRMRYKQNKRKKVPSPIPNGTEVILHNLSTQQYIGITGKIKSFTGERFIIDISKSNVGKDEISIRPPSVSQIISNVWTHSLNSAALNNQTVICRGYQEGYERIRCQFEDGTNRYVRPRNLIFPPGTLVRLDKLNDDRVNNHWGHIMDWLLDKERYEVKLDKYDKKYKLKPENVLI